MAAAGKRSPLYPQWCTLNGVDLNVGAFEPEVEKSVAGKGVLFDAVVDVVD